MALAPCKCSQTSWATLCPAPAQLLALSPHSSCPSCLGSWRLSEKSCCRLGQGAMGPARRGPRCGMGSSSCGCCCCGNSAKGAIFKNVAEILPGAQAAGNLISKRPGWVEGGREQGDTSAVPRVGLGCGGFRPEAPGRCGTSGSCSGVSTQSTQELGSEFD